MLDTKHYDIASFILRLSLGIMFIAHEPIIVMVFSLPGTVSFFESVGFPGWSAYIVTAMEIGGGALLITGLYTRQVALVLLPVLLGAFYAHFGNGWLFTNENGGWEYVAFLIAMTIVQALLGSGRYAFKFPVTR